MVGENRAYLSSHPWLSFKLSLTHVSYKLWMKLGEAQSKIEHIAGVLLLPYMEKELHKLYLAKGVQATTAIEGNTLTEKQILEQVDGQLKLPQSQEYMAQETQNIIDACNSLTTAVIEGSLDSFDVAFIRGLNSQVLKGLNSSEGVVPGAIRHYSVTVGQYRGAPAEDCAYLLGRLCEFLNTEFISDEIPKVVMGIVKAVIAHLYIAWIHPFGDGNGRTSRLMEFVILLQAGVPAPVAHLLSNHYNQTRAEYYRQLSLASQSGDALGFLNYAVDGFVDGLKEQIEKIKKYQRDITWQKFVYDAFKKEKLSSADKRRRDLVIELSSLDNPIAFSDVKLATPRIASAFAKVSQATLLRDLRVLADKELILISRGNVFVNKRLITAFLPSRAD